MRYSGGFISKEDKHHLNMISLKTENIGAFLVSNTTLDM